MNFVCCHTNGDGTAQCRYNISSKFLTRSIAKLHNQTVVLQGPDTVRHRKRSRLFSVSSKHPHLPIFDASEHVVSTAIVTLHRAIATKPIVGNTLPSIGTIACLPHIREQCRLALIALWITIAANAMNAFAIYRYALQPGSIAPGSVANQLPTATHILAPPNVAVPPVDASNVVVAVATHDVNSAEKRLSCVKAITSPGSIKHQASK